MLQPIIEDKADVVFGSRFTGGGTHRVHLFFHSLANRFLTTLSNMFTNLNLTDMEIGYKVFRTEILRKINLKQKKSLEKKRQELKKDMEKEIEKDLKKDFAKDLKDELKKETKKYRFTTKNLRKTTSRF